jgi:hypothetical protein
MYIIRHVMNQMQMQWKKESMYNFLQPLINETKFDIKIRLLYIKEFTNGILSTSECNHDLNL